MTRAMVLCILASALIGVSVGAVSGRNEGVLLSHSFDDLSTTFLSETTNHFAVRQSRHADSAHAREAVLLQIKVLQLLERSHKGAANELQLGSAYVRLSMIEEAAGDNAAEQAALQQARSYFKRLHPEREQTDDRLKGDLRKMDDFLDNLGF